MKDRFHHTSLLSFKTKIISWVWDIPNKRNTEVLTKPFGQKMSKHAWLHYALTVTKSLQPRAFTYRTVPTASKGAAFIKCEQELHWPTWAQQLSQERSQANEALWARPGRGEGFSAQQLNDSPCKESDKQEGLLHSDLDVTLMGF